MTALHEQVQAALIPTLTRLDALLGQAVANATTTADRLLAPDALRGLYLTDADVGLLLDRGPLVPAWPAPAAAGHLVEEDDAPPGLVALARDLGLTQFDMDVIVIAVAVEVDPRYERIFAYLQDDVTMRRPTVALTLDILTSSLTERLARQSHFGADAPLIRDNLVRLLADPGRDPAPLLMRPLGLDHQVLRVLIGRSGLDPRLEGIVCLVEPMASLEELVVTDELRSSLGAVAASVDGTAPLRLHLSGPPGSGRRKAGEAIARAGGVRLLVVDADRACRRRGADESLLALAFREARQLHAYVYVDDVDALRAEGELETLYDLLAVEPVGAILAGAETWTPPPARKGRTTIGIIELALPTPPPSIRRDAWQAALVPSGIELGDDDLDAVAERFVLTPGQIADAAATAAARLRSRRARASADDRPDDEADAARSEVLRSARRQTAHDLAKLATHVEPRFDWDDIVLSPAVAEHLKEICLWVTHRERVMGTWGFGRKLSRGRGIPCLFAGSPGTGKTMAAEVIGRSVGLDVFTVDLSGVVSKWVGETEKNLDRIFGACVNAILCFDEADALFGKRSEVTDAHDRYANIEVSYLLQKMESHEGLTILTTNMLESLDEAFLRRLAFVVNFPVPDVDERRQLWHLAWPPETPRAADIDIDHLAQEFRLTGGNIKNVALASAFLAAAEGTAVGMDHVTRALEREYEKMGKTLPAATAE